MNANFYTPYQPPAPLPPEYDPKYRKKERFNLGRIGLALFAYLLFSDIIQIAAVTVVTRYFPSLYSNELFQQLLSAVPAYLMGLPLAFGMLAGMPKKRPERQKLGAGGWFTFLALSFFGMYGGNIIGNMLMTFTEQLRGTQINNAVSEMISNTSPLYTLIFVVILAPIAEELLCRKLVIDRMLPYSEKLAVLVSGLFFGLLHRNFYQFFYATLVGLIFGYVYVKTGKIIHTILMHMLVNFTGSLVALFLQSELYEQDKGTLFWGIISEVYSVALLALAVCGCVRFFLRLRSNGLSERGTRALTFKSQNALLWSSVGTILFASYCGLYFIFSLFI